MSSFRLATGFVLVALLLLDTTSFARVWTDSSGVRKVEAELLAVRNGKAYLEKTDGSIVGVPLERLSKADRDYLASLSASKKPKTPTPKPVDNVQSGQHLARQALEILKSKCYRCHGEDGTSEGGFNFVLNVRKLADAYVESRDAAGSYLYERITDPDEESRMPPPGEEPRLSQTDVGVIRNWINAGAPEAFVEKPRTFITNEQVVSMIRDDLQQSSERSRRFRRYFTLTHLYNAGASDDELQTYRLALAKLSNSVSWNAALQKPVPIDPQKTILRIDIRDFNWENRIWDDISRSNPYAMKLPTSAFNECCELSQCDMPFVRGDWFVFAASKPPLYHLILGIPKTVEELEEMLRVNADANIDQERVMRAGFNRSGVSQNNRMIERHKSPFGSYWKSYDFGGNRGRKNLFAHPMGPKGPSAFEHDGGEMIFTLPNGLQGYMLTDERGNRIDKGPTDIVSDPRSPDRAVVNGISCMSCHYAGMIRKSDEVRNHVLTNRVAFGDADSILAIFPEQSALDKLFDEDGRRFSDALREIGIRRITKTGEPISTMATRFEQELDARLAAAEIGLSEESFNRKLAENAGVSRMLGTLRVSGGTIKRDVFVDVFARVVTEFGIVPNAGNVVGGRVPLARLDVDEDKVGEIRRFGNLGWGTSSLALSPDVGRVAVGKMDRALILFDLNTKKRLAFIEKLQTLGKVTSVAFSPDGTRLAAGGYSGMIIVWEVTREGRLKRKSQFVGHTGEIKTIKIASDGKWVLSGSADKSMCCWNLETGREIGAFKGFERAVSACHLSPDGRTALATDGKVLMEFDLGAGKVISTKNLGRGSSQDAAISPDGKWVVATDGYKIAAWNTKTGQALPRFEDREMQWSVEFLPNGKYIVSGGRQKANIWDLKTQRKVYVMEVGSNGYVQNLGIGADSRHLAASTSGAQQDVQVFRLPDLD